MQRDLEARIVVEITEAEAADLKWLLKEGIKFLNRQMYEYKSGNFSKNGLTEEQIKGYLGRCNGLKQNCLSLYGKLGQNDK